MAATSHPLSTLTALDVLRAGGNALDAAVAANAVQCVVEPQSTGIGGDCWMLYAEGGQGPVHAMNSSGWAPAAASAAALRARGLSAILQHSADAVSIPGAPAGWQSALQRFGRLGLAELLQPAIAFAEDGYPVMPRVHDDWLRAKATLQSHPGGRALFLLDGEVPEVGRMMRNPALAETFRRLAEDGAKAFYDGALTGPMLATLQAAGGVHSAADFADFEPEWLAPIDSSYKDVRVFECAPNGQGIVALLLLNMLEAFDLGGLAPHGADRFHLEAEATRLAFLYRDRYVADPRLAAVPQTELLDKALARRLVRRIDMAQAMRDLPPPALPPHPDTINISIVDRDLNCVSFINSIYDSFGSGIVCQQTGVTFHSRAKAFSLIEGHPNELAAHKRPLHTIIPGMAFRDDQAWLSFGVMGGDYQPVGHAHLISNMIDFGMDPQAAIESPRALAYPDALRVERGLADAVVRGLAERGHRIEAAVAPHGGGQAVMIDRQRGVLVGGSDHRKDGLALGY